LGRAGIAAPRADQDHRRAQQIAAFDPLTGPVLALELRCQRLLDLMPRHALREYRQRVPQIDHGVDPAAEKVRRLHLPIPQKSTPIGIEFKRNRHRDSPRKASIHAG